MKSYYADLHIHIGRTEQGKPVKISGSRNLTFYNIAREASERKGIDIVGVIDCHSPTVQEEIMNYLDRGDMVELEGGGIRYHQTTVLLGSEIEVRDPEMKPAHLLAYLPTLDIIQGFTHWMRKYMKNIELSSQRIYVTARELQEEVTSRGGILIPAHVFTPHKSVYGSAANRMSQLLDLSEIAAVELGLSSDTEMASHISELDPFSFVTNSDAHSLAKIGREYNQLKLETASFTEVVKALAGKEGRYIEANFGLNPRLGKYHRTFCAQCDRILDELQSTVNRCLDCGSAKIIRGVMDRIQSIADRKVPRIPEFKPPYIYQVPLEYIPGLGKRKLEQLLSRFHTEMNILHKVPLHDLSEVVGEEIAFYIVQARIGSLSIEVGGGGRYGRVSKK
jgi:uncharacterized protein (TIGR00375 family)